MVRPSLPSNEVQSVVEDNGGELQRIAVDIRSASLSTGSVTAYQRAVQRWEAFCRQSTPHRHRSFRRQSGVEQLDQCVCRYLASIYRDGDGRRRQLAVNTVYGLYLLHPRIRHRLVESDQLLRGWSRLRPSSSHPPLTWPLVTLIAVTMAGNSYGDGAIATLVSFDALLRISEMASLRVQDVSPPSDPRRGRPSMPSSSSSSGTGSDGGMVGSSHVLLRLRITKTGRNQWVELTNSSIEKLLVHHITGRDGDELVFNLTAPGCCSHGGPSDYRYAFSVVCRTLGLGSIHFTPHSLRHGGATHALQHLRQSIETVMHRGRWRSMSSCQTYLQSGRAQLLEHIIDPSIWTRANTVADVWYNCICNELYGRMLSC